MAKGKTSKPTPVSWGITLGGPNLAHHVNNVADIVARNWLHIIQDTILGEDDEPDKSMTNLFAMFSVKLPMLQ